MSLVLLRLQQNNYKHCHSTTHFGIEPQSHVLAGSYLCVAGSFINIMKPGRMSMFGTLLIVWGLVKEGILEKPLNTDQNAIVFVYSTMLLALVATLLSVKYDIKKAVNSYQLNLW